ncbi:unnamed protein product [Cylindrotheca closterium]|uniref:Uncharacterized protein n=1 Tax=Cylindrotheca closterium TaxID=2856 RepID=A0AAD2G1C7_9STRA|nr:unnamed protein product [Cylindrotheca closterium]
MIFSIVQQESKVQTTSSTTTVAGLPPLPSASFSFKKASHLMNLYTLAQTSQAQVHDSSNQLVSKTRTIITSTSKSSSSTTKEEPFTSATNMELDPGSILTSRVVPGNSMRIPTAISKPKSKRTAAAKATVSKVKPQSPTTTPTTATTKNKRIRRKWVRRQEPLLCKL